eukprot:TRINITY_DN55114_c0_g1_i1.p1 TRINITY_DN55114_c0_g1~~TRINITY_DN55114_c0_g1_i1.p1  ORF type:complete len:1034 (+),score=407.66 TRINITY_DN55114_c0_g1_i1:82-3183(+)
MVDAQQLHVALLNGFNPQPELRHQAEEFLQAAEGQPGFVGSLYQVAAHGEVQLHIRQAASIRLKRVIEPYDWNADRSKVTPEEKALLKSTILDAISSTPPQVNRQLLEVLRHVVTYDFPANWPGLVPQVTAFLQSQDMAKARGALCALRKLAKRYEYIGGGSDRKAESAELSKAYLPVLLSIFRTVNAQSQVQTEQVADIQKLLLKIFYSLIHHHVPDAVRDDPAALDGWMTCAGQVLSMTVDPAAADEPSAAAWKAKKWVGHVVTHLLDKYGKLKQVRQEYKDFSKRWTSQYGPRFVTAALDFVAARAAGVPVPDQPLSRLLWFLHQSLGTKAMYEQMRPQIDTLVQQHIFPLLCFSEEDAELWQSNPHEYVRKIHCCEGVAEDFYNPRMTAIGLLVDVCSAPKPYHDQGVMMRTLNFLSGELQQSLNSGDPQLIRRKYGALCAIGSIRKVLVDSPQIKPQLEGLIVTHVFPGFSSPCGFLRANSLWVISRFAGRIDWAGDGANFRTALEANLRLMRDPDLPVRVQAGLSLKYVVGNEHAAPLVKPMLGDIVQECFGLMDQIDVEDLVTTLEVVIGIYGDQMMSQAAVLCERLGQHFLKVTHGGTEDTDMETVGAGSGCLATIATLVQAVHEHPAVVRELQAVCEPLILRLLQPECSEYFQETMQLVSDITQYADQIKPQFWAVFVGLATVFEAYAYSMPEQMLAPFDNFISRDPATFCRGNPEQGISYVMIIFKVCKYCLEADVNDSEACVAPKLAESMLQHAKQYRPALDEALPSFLDITFARLGNPQTSTYMKVLLCGTVFNALWYNAPLTLQYLEGKGATAQFFTGWRELLPKVRRIMDRKMVALGLSALLELLNGGAQLPAFFDPQCISSMVGVTLKFVIENWQAMQELDEAADSDSTSDGDDERGFIDDEDEEGEDPPEGSMDAALAKLVKAAREADEESDCLSLAANDDDEIIWSVIDETSEAKFFAEQLARIRGERPQVFEELVRGIDPAQLEMLQPAVKYGEQRAAAAAERNRQLAAGTFPQQ